MITKDLLVIPGNKLYIINVNDYKFVRIIDIPGSKKVSGICLVNKSVLYTGDVGGKIIQWKIDGDNLYFISQKQKAHNDQINVLLNMKNGQIASGSDDYSIKIW